MSFQLLSLPLALGAPTVLALRTSSFFYWFFAYLFCSLSVHVWYEAWYGDPEKEADKNDSADDVVPEEFEHGVDVEVVDEVPDPRHHVLHRTLTPTVVAKTLAAPWSIINIVMTLDFASPIREFVNRIRINQF